MPEILMAQSRPPRMRRPGSAAIAVVYQKAKPVRDRGCRTSHTPSGNLRLVFRKSIG